MQNAARHVGASMPTVAAGALMAAALAGAAGMTAAASLDCARVTSKVDRLICATPALAKADRKLETDFSATAAQGGIDSKPLRAKENTWVRAVRDRCADVACLEAAYAARDRAVLNESLQAASPAAWEEIRPFPVPAARLARARALIGKPCGDAPAAPLPGFARIEGALPVVVDGGMVDPLEIEGSRFAFLLIQSPEDPGVCAVADVVALLGARAGMALLQCRLGDDGDHGFGMRGGGKAPAYWSVDLQNRRLTRQPLRVLSGSRLVCQPPETGE